MQNQIEYQWFIARDGKQYGPVPDYEIRQLASGHELRDTDYLWRQGFAEWMPAKQVREIHHPPANQSSTALNPAMQSQHASQGSPFHTPSASENLSEEAKRFSEESASAHPATMSTRDALLREEQVINAEGGTGEETDHDLHKQNDTTYSQDTSSEFEESGNLSQHPSNHDTIATDLTEDSNLTHPITDPVSQPSIQQTQSLPAKEYDPSLVEVRALEQEVETQDPNLPAQRTGRDMEPSLSAATGDYAYAHELKRKSSWLKRLSIAAVLVLVSVLAIGVAIPFIVPANFIQNKVAEVIEKNTGRKAEFKGKIGYRFFPSFGVDLNNVILHNPPSIKGPPLLSVGRIETELKILPLLKKSVEIDRVILHRPDLTLIKDKGNKNNWTFAATNNNASSTQAELALSKQFQVAQINNSDGAGIDIIAETIAKMEAEEKAQQEKQNTIREKRQAKLTTLRNLQLAQLKVINGSVKYIDQTENKSSEIQAINLDLTAPSLDKAVSARGSFRLFEQRLNLDLQASTLETVATQQPTNITLNINGELLSLDLNGDLKFEDSVGFEGQSHMMIKSVANLMRVLGSDVPGQGYGPAEIKGILAGKGENWAFRKGDFQLDKLKAKGNIDLSLGQKRPYISADLNSSYIDVTPFLGQTASIRYNNRSFAANAKSQSSAFEETSANHKKPQITAIAAWQSSRIDFSALKLVDANVKLNADQLVYQKHKLNNSKVAVKLNAGHLNAALSQFEAYGGTGQALISLNSARSMPAMRTRINLANIDIKPLLINASDLDWLSGKSNMQLDLTAQGNSQKEMVQTLNGSGKLALADGAFEGVNIPVMVRNLQRGKLTGWSKSKTEKTDFSSVDASFTIDKGILSNRDLTMLGPLLRLKGAGQIDLVNEQLNYGVQPKLVASLTGQGGESSNKGINIPVRITGHWANPKFTPDVNALINDPETVRETVDTVKKVIDQVKKKKITGKDIKKLLEGGDDASELLGKFLNPQ